MRTRRSSRQHAMGSGRRRLLAERPERTLSRHFVPTAPEGPRRQPYGYRLRPARAPSAAFPAVRDLMNQAIWSTSVGGVPPCIFFLFSTFPYHRPPELAAERRAGQSQDRGPIPRQDVVQSQDVILARYRDTNTLSESPVVRERYEPHAWAADHVPSCILLNVQWDVFHGCDARGAVGAARFAGFLEKFEEWLDDVDRHRKDDGGILFCADLRQRLQIAQLHGRRNASEDLRRIDKGLRGLELGFRMDDLGAPVAFRLRLLG